MLARALPAAMRAPVHDELKLFALQGPCSHARGALPRQVRRQARTARACGAPAATRPSPAPLTNLLGLSRCSPRLPALLTLVPTRPRPIQCPGLLDYEEWRVAQGIAEAIACEVAAWSIRWRSRRQCGVVLLCDACEWSNRSLAGPWRAFAGFLPPYCTDNTSCGCGVRYSTPTSVRAKDVTWCCVSEDGNRAADSFNLNDIAACVDFWPGLISLLSTALRAKGFTVTKGGRKVEVRPPLATCLDDVDSSTVWLLTW
jgi:hypothetical protein